jgi:hypothetical protein
MVWDVPDDGDCYFHSFAWSTRTPVEGIRRRAVEALFASPEAEAALRANQATWARRVGTNKRSRSGRSIRKVVDEDDGTFSVDAWQQAFDEDGEGAATLDEFIAQAGIPTLHRVMLRPDYWADDFLIAALQEATGVQTLVLGRAGRGYGPRNLVTDPYAPMVLMVSDGRHFEPVSVGRRRLWERGVGQLDPPRLRAMGLQAAAPMLDSVPMPPGVVAGPPDIVAATATAPGMVGVADGRATFRSGPIDPPRDWALTLTLADGQTINVHVAVDQDRLQHLLIGLVQDADGVWRLTSPP